VTQQILLGFEVPTGKPVQVPMAHLIVTGMTQLSGKTTTLEALLTRGQLTALTFRTKRGELGFESAHQVPLFFDQRGLAHWRVLEGLLSSTLEEKVQREPGVRGAIIRLCSGVTGDKPLDMIYKRNQEMLTASKGFMRDVHEKIKAYLDLVMPQLTKWQFTGTLNLEPGLNMMDLEELSDEMQALVIFACTEWVSRKCKNTILVIVEAWHFLPQDRGSPCKPAVEKLMREGAVIGNFVWIDSQDLRGVDKKFLRQVDNWILGRQRDPREIDSTLDVIPLAKRLKPQPEEIMQLKLGHFIACLHDDVKRVYVQPAWMDETQAAQIARGTVLVPMTRPEPGAKLGGLHVDEAALLKAVHQTIEQAKSELENRMSRMASEFNTVLRRLENDTAGQLLQLKEIVHGGIIGLVNNIAHTEEEWRIKHTEKELHLTTETIHGQIMYAIVNDLEGRQVNMGQIQEAMREHSWTPHIRSIQMNMANLVAKGTLVKEGPANEPVYRTPKKVKLTVEKT